MEYTDVVHLMTRAVEDAANTDDPIVTVAASLLRHGCVRLAEVDPARDWYGTLLDLIDVLDDLPIDRAALDCGNLACGDESPPAVVDAWAGLLTALASLCARRARDDPRFVGVSAGLLALTRRLP